MNSFGDFFKVFHHTEEIGVLDDDRAHLLVEEIKQSFPISSAFILQIGNPYDLLLFRIDISLDHPPVFRMDSV